MKIVRVYILCCICCLLFSWPVSLVAADHAAPAAVDGARLYINLNEGWRFANGDFANAMLPDFKDDQWRQLDVPHDWSSEGPFGTAYGSGNGYAPGGIAWYRKRFRLPADQAGKAVAVEFDGIYNHSQVWINGHYVGGRPYGYSSFECALTPLLKFGAAENVLAVRVDHSRFADSRWYTGSGIYREVRLRVTDRLRIAHWGTFVSTPEVNETKAVVQIEVELQNDTSNERAFTLESALTDPNGNSVATLATTATIGGFTNQFIRQKISIPAPQLWSVDSPVLYNLRNRLTADSSMVDECRTPFGIRTLKFDPDRGLFLNGRAMKLKGVCLHHDAGTLGAAVPAGVLERRLRILKSLGANAIRTSHNPPAPELLDLGDQIGLLVKDEAFDEFTPAKNKWVTGWNSGLPSRFGYAEDFVEWGVRDMEDLVRRDRNHPSVILWSIGNEVDFANDPFSHPVLGNNYRPANPSASNLVTHARPLIAAVKRLDPTRPVTAALANVEMSDAVGLGEMLDVVGYNYQESRYATDHASYPQRIIFGSENGGQFGNWEIVRTNDYVAGQFLWTGIDYLGEARAWPIRGSGAGLLDLCGFRKPNAWFRQSLWSDLPMVYLCATPAARRGPAGRGSFPLEHWNWESNAVVTVRCYTTCEEVALTLNDRPLGTKLRSTARDGVLVWEVPFEPGVLKAVGLKNGSPSSEFILRTAGAPARIELVPDKMGLSQKDRQIAHVEFRVTDAEGVIVPDATHPVEFGVEGPATLLGLENGELASADTGKTYTRRVFRGRGLAILRVGEARVKIQLNASCPGLQGAKLELQGVNGL